MVLRTSVSSLYASFIAAYVCVGVFLKIHNEISTPHVVPGVMEEVRSSVHSTSLQFWRNFSHVFTQHKTENVRTTARHNVTMWNFAVIFFGTFSFQLCVCSLHYQHSHIARIKFPTAQISIRVYAYAFKRNLVRAFYLRYRADLFTGDVTNSGLYAAFFTFSIHSGPDL